jgi:hypothetical protein
LERFEGFKVEGLEVEGLKVKGLKLKVGQGGVNDGNRG